MLDFYLNAFILLFVVLDPVGMAPTFGAITRGSSELHRRPMALRACLLSFVILVLFAVAGNTILRHLGIGLPAFGIAGGLLLFLLAVDMVFARQSGLRSTTEREQAEAAGRADVSVFPLAFPLIAGPGAMTTVLLLAGRVQGQPWAFAGLLAILALEIGLVLGALLLAGRITRILGETGANVVSRLLGLILTALAVQLVLDGIKAALL